MSWTKQRNYAAFSKLTTLQRFKNYLNFKRERYFKPFSFIVSELSNKQSNIYNKLNQKQGDQDSQKDSRIGVKPWANIA